MRGSIKLITLAGIGLYLHWTFAILIFGLPLLYISGGATWWAAIEGLIFVLAIFGCVVLHEYGHALTARRYGIPTKDITLLPIGGLARLERIPEEPRQELAIAAMGPAVNVVIAIVLFTGQAVYGSIVPPDAVLSDTTGNFASRLAWINLALVVFNMLPAFPMDGGRVLRAFLAMRMDYVRATHIAAQIGKGMAVVFGFLSFFGNFFLLFIALFVYLGAQQESHYTRMRSLMEGLTAGQAMITRFEQLRTDQSLADAIDLLKKGYQNDFVVVSTDGDLIGLLPRDHLLRVLPTHGADVPVSAVMLTDFETIDAFHMLTEAYRKMNAAGIPMVPVLRNNELVGILTPKSIGEFVMIGSALRRPNVQHRQDLRVDQNLEP